MPKPKNIQLKKVNLSSIEGGWIEIKEELTIGDIETFEAADLSKNKNASRLKVLITSWNLEGEDGAILPINEENINKLTVKDLAVIVKELGLGDVGSFLGGGNP